MPDVKPIPDGYTAITPYLIVENAVEFIDFLSGAFGAVERLRMAMPQGGIGHAEVEIDGRYPHACRRDAPRVPSPPAASFTSTSLTATPFMPRL